MSSVRRNNDKEETTMENLKKIDNVKVADMYLDPVTKTVYEAVEVDAAEKTVELYIVKDAKPEYVGQMFTVDEINVIKNVNTGGWWLTFRRSTN
jgi:hypothetical protein